MGRLAARALSLAFVVWVAAGTGAPTRAQEETGGGIDGLVADLVSGDAKRSAAAVDALAARGRSAALELVRPALRNAGGPGEEAILAAFEAIGADESIAFLYANQTEWPGNRRGVEDLVAKVRELRKSPPVTTVRLRSGTLKEPRRLPHFAECRVTDVIPARLAGADLPVEIVDGRLEIDTRGDGKGVTVVSPDRPEAVELGPPPSRTLWVHCRRGRWFAGSASTLVGKLRSESVELLDADADGRFDGPADLLALDGAPFQRMEDAAFVHTANGTARCRVVEARGKATLEVVAEPVLDGVDATLLGTVAELNGWRRGVGLPPTFLDLPRSRECQLHAEYWRINGYSGHEEHSSNAGFTKEGARAGKRSSVTDSPDPVLSVHLLTGTILHRETTVADPRQGLGIGYSIGTCVRGGDVRAGDRAGPVLVPAAGQGDVPTLCARESPAPERDLDFYEKPRGYPVSVWYDGLYRDVADANVQVWPADAGVDEAPLPGTLFSQEQPYREEFDGKELTCFVADAPLRPGTWYHACFAARADGRDVEIWWSFRTR